MCVTLGPGHLTDTILLAAEAAQDGKTVHLMGYQNRPASASGPNAMILPIPAVPGTVKPENLILTAAFPHILDDVARAIKPPTRAAAFLGRALPQDAVVFEHGIYTVVLAGHARAIAPALELVPDHKRPPLNEAIFAAYDAWYPGWAVALCCFNNADAQQAQPILIAYEPRFPAYLFAPGLDSHSGDVPDRGAEVAVDHIVAFAAQAMAGGRPVRYRDDLPDAVRTLLPEQVSGDDFRGLLPNGDWLCRVADVRAGRFDQGRIAPPFFLA